MISIPITDSGQVVLLSVGLCMGKGTPVRGSMPSGGYRRGALPCKREFSMTKLLPFQREFISRRLRIPAVRHSGYQWAEEHWVRSWHSGSGSNPRCLTPGDSLHQFQGKEYILGAASLEQARLTYSFIRAELWNLRVRTRWIDSTTRLGAITTRPVTPS